jgi:xylulokinase
MAGKYLLGIDVGTSGTKGVITDLKGRVLAFQATETETSSPQPGWYEHDAEKTWWGSFCQVTQALLQEIDAPPTEIAAVGASALCPDMLPLDEAGRPLRSAILYGIDARAQGEIDELNALFGEEFIFERSANVLSGQSITPKYLWFKHNEPELAARTRMIHSATGYLVYKLTGEHVVDYGIAIFYGPLYDIRTLKWDEKLANKMGLDVELLPRAAPATDVAGEVTEQAAAETGLAPGTPVIVGSCDASAEALSGGSVLPGDAAITVGSTICLFVNMDEVKTHPSLSFFPYVVPGLFALGAGTATAASVTRWFRDNFGHVEMETERLLGLNAYQLLSDEAAQIPPGSEGLLVLPYFAGERTPLWDPQARGLVVGLTLSHGRAHVYRALLEGTAHSVRHNLDVMGELGADVQRLVATGGGTRNLLWMQIISDVTGIPIEIPVTAYGSPYGCAYMAGYGAGLFQDFDVLRNEWVRIARRLEPNSALKPRYDKYHEIYRRLYEHTREDMHALAQLSCDSGDICI